MKAYILTQPYKAPYVVATGIPSNPQRIMMKSFRSGEMVKGELKHANNKPAFVLVGGTLVLPLSVLKEVTTKEVVSEASGSTTETSEQPTDSVKKVPTKKLRYIDAILIGGVLGFGAVYLAEKQGWITSPDNKNKMYGVLGGAVLGAYLVFRQENTIPIKPKTNE
jgi:uncharacterized membrane protein YraQ (UPF0718 family)